MRSRLIILNSNNNNNNNNNYKPDQGESVYLAFRKINKVPLFFTNNRLFYNVDFKINKN